MDLWLRFAARDTQARVAAFARSERAFPWPLERKSMDGGLADPPIGFYPGEGMGWVAILALFKELLDLRVDADGAEDLFSTASILGPICEDASDASGLISRRCERLPGVAEGEVAPLRLERCLFARARGGLWVPLACASKLTRKSSSTGPEHSISVPGSATLIYTHVLDLDHAAQSHRRAGSAGEGSQR